VATAFSPGYFIMSIPYDGSAPKLVAEFSVEDPKQPGDPIVIGNDVVYWAVHDDRAREHIYHAETGVTEPLLDIPGYDVFGVGTDGQTIVWMQHSPPNSVAETKDAIELWSSPFATSAAGLSPKKLADLAPSMAKPYTRLESGMYVIRGTVVSGRDSSWSRDIVYRLSDNTYWTVDAPAGSWWGEILYVTEEEIALPVQPPKTQSETFTIRRQKLADLGPPQPVSGVIQ
jgi:hypothetical protein